MWDLDISAQDSRLESGFRAGMKSFDKGETILTRAYDRAFCRNFSLQKTLVTVILYTMTQNA